MKRASGIASAVTVVLIMLLCVSCGSGGGNPVEQGLMTDENNGREMSDSHHSLLGLFQFSVLPDENEIQVVPLRNGEFHLNAMKWLEPPPPVRIQVSNFVKVGKVIDIDVQLEHPFPGFDKFTGFDVCGILITNGSVSGFSDGEIVIADEGDTRLLNADGLTRWWNPREFPYNSSKPMWGYIDGIYGTPDSSTNFSATLNGFKYFADEVGENDPVSGMPHESRGVFSAGGANSRHYKIDLGSGLVFNYAVDAVWVPPVDDPPVIPGSFPESANREEPYFLTVQITKNSLLFNPSTGIGGGDIGFNVDCYDWFDGEKNTIRIESPGLFDAVTSTNVTGGSETYSTYSVEVSGIELSNSDPVPVWISAEKGMDFDELLPGKTQSIWHPKIEMPVEINIPGGEFDLDFFDEKTLTHIGYNLVNDFEPALIRNGSNQMILSFIAYEPTEDAKFPLFAVSGDGGIEFGEGISGGWFALYGGELSERNKAVTGSNGQAFQYFWNPSDAMISTTPKIGGPFEDEGSHSGTPQDNAGELIYSVDGFPMLFGDEGGNIKMRMGSKPNVAGTETWPIFSGTEYTLTNSGDLYLSLSRCGVTMSDGIYYIFLWSYNFDGYVQEVYSLDSLGTMWSQPSVVYQNGAELFTGVHDPGVWVDEDEGIHIVFALELFTLAQNLVYGYKADGDAWDFSDFITIENYSADNGLRDTQVVTVEKFGETFVILSYESGGVVYTRWKKLSDEVFSDEIQVNIIKGAVLPDVYPNNMGGVVFGYEAIDGTGSDLTDIFYRRVDVVQK